MFFDDNSGVGFIVLIFRFFDGMGWIYLFLFFYLFNLLFGIFFVICLGMGG